MLRRIFFSIIVSGSVLTGFAQDSTKTAAAAPPAFTINGSADVYYRYDFGKSKYNNLTSFTNSHNSFELGMATLKLEHKTAKVDFVADLGFGKRAQEFAYNDNGIVQSIKQLYISYSPAAWIKFTAGTWATHVGYELLDAYSNRNYSMSYMFTNGPFSHTGLRADLTSGKNGFMIGISNPTDYRAVPAGVLEKKFLIAQYSYAAGDIFKAYLNYVGGQGPDTSKHNQFDLVVTSKLSSMFSLAVNGTYHILKPYTGLGGDGGQTFGDTKNWYGAAVYLNLDPSPSFGLTLRGEYFSDKDGISSSVIGGNVFAATLSAQWKVDNFILIPEVRFDNASVERFTKGDGTPTKSGGSLLVAAIYSF